MLETLTHRRFANRRAAGQALAERVRALGLEDPVILGLARGGVPVAYEIAQALAAPLDVLVVRKIGSPGNPELGIGAVAEGGVRVLDQDAVRELLVSTDELEVALARATAEVEERVRRYRNGRPLPGVEGRDVVVVDDGLATGGTARAALRAMHLAQPRRLILAVPIGAQEVVEALREEAVEVVCLLEPELLLAVGLWYREFEPTSDSEIEHLLADDPPDPPEPAVSGTRVLRIPVLELVGNLTIPEDACGLVVFAQGSAATRFSPRTRQLAKALNERRLGTLRLDLLRWDEERDRTRVFDIGLLCERLVTVTRRLRAESDLEDLPIGYFGEGTGASAALRAAAALGDQVGAVVSNSGRPDLVGPVLGSVRAAVLLIVGAEDQLLLELNREARRQLRAPSELEIVPGTTHMLEPAEVRESVIQLTGDWLERHLRMAQKNASALAGARS